MQRRSFSSVVRSNNFPILLKASLLWLVVQCAKTCLAPSASENSRRRANSTGGGARMVSGWGRGLPEGGGITGVVVCIRAMWCWRVWRAGIGRRGIRAWWKVWSGSRCMPSGVRARMSPAGMSAMMASSSGAGSGIVAGLSVSSRGWTRSLKRFRGGGVPRLSRNKGGVIAWLMRNCSEGCGGFTRNGVHAGCRRGTFARTALSWARLCADAGGGLHGASASFFRRSAICPGGACGRAREGFRVCGNTYASTRMHALRLTM